MSVVRREREELLHTKKPDRSTFRYRADRGGESFDDDADVDRQPNKYVDDDEDWDDRDYLNGLSR